MELDDLKKNWKDISKPGNIQLSDKTIDNMKQQKYQSKLNKIAVPEMVGILVCLAATVFIALQFYKLHSLFLKAAGIACIAVLISLSAISLLSLRRINTAVAVDKPYAETLRQFALQRIQFVKLQKLNALLSYLLLVLVIFLMPAFTHGKDLTANPYFWTLSFGIGYIFLLFYSKWVSKYYGKTLQQAAELLKALEA